MKNIFICIEEWQWQWQLGLQNKFAFSQSDDCKDDFLICIRKLDWQCMSVLFLRIHSVRDAYLKIPFL